MQHVQPKWLKSGLVLVCEKCYKERIPDEDPEVAERIGDFNLRDWLKKRLKADGHWGKVRAVGTTCMDVCARRLVTVAIAPQSEHDDTEVVVLDPINGRNDLYERIVKRLKSRV